ncbi:MAG: hypothetical protein HQM11_12330 [SAR324 cluster bacterium]|nr:hypothetical protein [SAR324 cluster bacterium]
MENKETFHLMAVPRHFTQEVIDAGGKFMRIKSNRLDPDQLQLIQWNNTPEPMIHILDPSQHRDYEMLGSLHEEDLSLCKAVFEQSRGEGYHTFEGNIEQVGCAECRIKLFKT